LVVYKKIMQEMERTQIYLPRELKVRARQQAALHGENLSEYIREKLEEGIQKEKEVKTKRKEAFAAAFGLWKDRDDLPDFDKLRKNWRTDDSL
jgi:hypothetical protein